MKTEVYRKRGRVVRYDHGTLVRVVESGIAIETGELFECRPEAAEELFVLDETAVERTARAIESMPLELERLIVSEGAAEHQFENVTWREDARRIHLSFAKGSLRVLLDLAEFDLDEVRRVAEALARAEDSPRERPRELRLASNVTAALLSSLPDSVQTAGGIDGKGRPIAEARGGRWPNWYRPSYRVRPARAPLNLRAGCPTGGIDPSLPAAVALLAPAEGTLLRVLVDDGTRVYPSSVNVTRLRAVAPSAVWYPYGGGAFGAEALV